MNGKKVGISTLFTGYNFGSALQAYATKIILNELGYEGVLLTLKGSLIKGRDVRLKKILAMMTRSMFHYNTFKKHLKAYKISMSKELTEVEKRLFKNFSQLYLQPCYTTWRKLKREAIKGDFHVFLAGSDQIWNSEAVYVDPFYYLRFAPREKRIAFVPSFGRHYVADYNKKIIGKYISGFNYISVREKSAVGIVKELTGRNAECFLDPTLVLSKENWAKIFNISSKNDSYILAYFLNEPSVNAKQFIEKLAKEKGIKVLLIGCNGTDGSWFDEKIYAGPKEFVEYLSNAKYVCTDSFHGTAFSLNFNIPFFTFKRQYGSAGEQSERIKSLLNLTNMESRYEPEAKMISETFNVSLYEEILESERRKSRKYLLDSLRSI